MTTAPRTLPSDPPPVVVNDPNIAPPPEPAPADPIEPVDEFADMFKQFATPELAPGDPAATPPVVAAQPIPEPAPGDPAATPPEPTPEPVAQPPVGNEVFERLAAAIEARNQQPVTAPQPPIVQAPQAFFTADETAALTQFYQEWPEIARAQELTTRAAVHQTTQHVFNEIAKVLGPKLAMLDALANNQQYDYLERRIPDYATLQDKVAEWVDKQPPYLRSAYTGVMQSGTPEEVEDLIQRYRQAEGGTSPNPGIAPQGGRHPNLPPAGSPTALTPAANKAAARLAPVSGKRTGPATGEPQTFEDAFAAFARTA